MLDSVLVETDDEGIGGRRFDHEGLHQLQDSLVADEDLHGRNVLPCQGNT